MPILVGRLLHKASLSSMIALVMNIATIGQERASVKVIIESPQRAIEEKARLVRVDDERSLSFLADEIFAMPRPFPRLPASMETFVKNRLVRAERAYLQGVGPGVSESDVVGLINWLADEINAPQYAKTSNRQVRFLRMTLALSAPIFMGRGMTRREMIVGDSVEPELSPLQAAHLVATLVEHKLGNPDFQLDVEEWESERYRRSIEAWKAQKALVQAEQRPTSHTTRVSTSLAANPKRAEMRGVMSQAAASMSGGDAWKLIDRMFSILKI